ncbi:MAG: redoxin domain-containing protein [Flavitalea sp.]
MLSNNSKAPDFTLYSPDNKEVKLSDYKGRKVLLVFYPADFSPVCGDQLALYNEMQNIFEEHDTQVLGISVDSRWCHLGYKESRNLDIMLLADFEPKGKVSKLYEVYDEEEGTARRGLYLLDEEGTIKWSYLSPIDENPGADGILEALESMEGATSK